MQANSANKSLVSRVTEFLDTLLFKGATKAFLVRIILLITLNYPLFQLKDQLQIEARRHLEPGLGLLAAFFLAVLLSIFIAYGLANQRRIIREWRAVIFFILFFLITSYWIFTYFFMTCDICDRPV